MKIVITEPEKGRIKMFHDLKGANEEDIVTKARAYAAKAHEFKNEFMSKVKCDPELLKTPLTLETYLELYSNTLFNYMQHAEKDRLIELWNKKLDKNESIFSKKNRGLSAFKIIVWAGIITVVSFYFSLWVGAGYLIENYLLKEATIELKLSLGVAGLVFSFFIGDGIKEKIRNWIQEYSKLTSSNLSDNQIK